jgi:glyoxylase-like metal-dependent hydrolase (beta-lactamase superfamily II)
MEIYPGIYKLQVPIPNNPLGTVNCYLIEGRSGWFMIDTGWFTGETFNSLQAGLKEIGLSFNNISTIVITHVHPDHFGLAGRIKQVSPRTQLLTHQWESTLIESLYIKFAELKDKMSLFLACNGVPETNLSALDSASMPLLEFVNVTFPDRVLYGGEILNTGIYDIEVIWTPGHSPGHICLYEPKNRLLFSGDHVLPNITPNISYHVQSGDNPLGEYLSALHKIQKLPVDKVLPAHGNIFSDLQGRMRQIIDHHKNRKNEIQRFVANNLCTAWEVAANISWDTTTTWDKLHPHDKRSAVTEVIAHLEFMRWEGEVQRVFKNKSTLYIAD